ncbi:sulfite reductase flavo protein alpha-component [Microdochium bolleyi]|uniref:NADPH--hemoprotein reductase n=1 Tax=Microdochium bolleyi TaxID=196109 RepID=A0A136IY31_9PEZI|nr:sulfite reductase flavo protein alpha-component [Microdochium bolleyi]
MSERSCPVSGAARGQCPASHDSSATTSAAAAGPRGCAFSGYTQPGDVRAAFSIPESADAEQWLRQRERKAINEILYPDFPTPKELNQTQNIDTIPAADLDLLAVALGAPARQVILRAQEIGPRTGWKDGFLTTEYGFVPPDMNVHVAALARSPGRIWSDLCERVPGCLARGRLRECVAALPLVEGTIENIPDQALWAALVALGMLCSIYRWEERNEGINVLSSSAKIDVEMSDDVILELKGIPKTIGLPYFQISKRMGRAIPHLSFPDQSSYNVKIIDPTSTYPYVARFENMELRWPMFGERSEIAFLKGCADTSGSFQHGPDAIANCQEHVMTRNVEGLLREMVRLKEILEQMPNAFHSISPNPSSGENYVAADRWTLWGNFSTPLSKRTPAASGLQFPPYLLMDAFLGRKKYSSFLGAEAVHLRAWQPSNLRAFIAAVEYHYSVPEFVMKSGDSRLMGVLDGIIEAYTGERGFMGVHRYKVWGILSVAAKCGRAGTNGNSGSGDTDGRPWEETHRQFADAMKERLEVYRGKNLVEPHQMRGSFEECRYPSSILSRSQVDGDASRTIAKVTLDLQDTGVTFQPGDRLAVMPLNGWDECAKVLLALGLEDMLEVPVMLTPLWTRFAEHLGSIRRTPPPSLTVKDIIRRGHLAPLTKELVLKVHALLQGSSSIVVQALSTPEWPIRGSLGDLLQASVLDTPPDIWDQAFSLMGGLHWLGDLVHVEVPRTYSISQFSNDLLPSTLDLSVSRAVYEQSSLFSSGKAATRCGVGSGFLNPFIEPSDEPSPIDEEVLIGVSKPVAFHLPLDGAAPCAYFAGGSGIAPFRSFWQARISRGNVGRNILYLGVQSRDKFCYEEELREHVSAGHMEVHTAFSRDNRGLVYDAARHQLTEKAIAPRYIDALIIEQSSTICDLVMSKKQGGLGGYLYVCGSVAVFDSVMTGIRKAVYNQQTTTMDSTDDIINTAFAERRFMLDIFMTPKPLPCNTPTITLSQLAKHTGHRAGTGIWIAVHGKVYDVTSFCPMHPGGTLIIKSNAGVDCSKSFDDLAHTNNPEVSSLLTKYYIGDLAPKPEYPGTLYEISRFYDLWQDYLRTVVETLVAQQFEMNTIMDKDIDASLDPTAYWTQGNILSIRAVKRFYQYQSRLLQGGFAALFGPKFQELVLKLSFGLANLSSDGAATRLPDVLGIIARAKTSDDAVATSRQVSLVGEFVTDSRGAHFHEKGIMSYARTSVELDISLLEDIRDEVTQGMDAFGAVMSLNLTSESRVTSALIMVLMQILERMAQRLQVFYSKLATYSVHQPAIERNPARTRWHIVRQRVRDGSLFILTQDALLDSSPSFFESVIMMIQQTLKETKPPMPAKASDDHHRGRTTLASRHTEQAKAAQSGGVPMLQAHEDGVAVRNMSTFISRNMRSIRRLSRLPANDLPDFSEISPQVPAGHPLMNRNLADFTPPTSRDTSRSPELPMPSRTGKEEETRRDRRFRPGSLASSTMGSGMLPSRPPSPPSSVAPVSDGATAALTSKMGSLNTRPRPHDLVSSVYTSSTPSASPGGSSVASSSFVMMRPGGQTIIPASSAAGPSRPDTGSSSRSRSRSASNALKSFKLPRWNNSRAETEPVPGAQL